MATAEFTYSPDPPVILTLTNEEARALRDALGQLNGKRDGTYDIFDVLDDLLNGKSR